MNPLLLTADDLVALTGYRQHSRQLAWLESKLRIKAPVRADGMPIVSRAQLEAALAGQQPKASSGPNWSRVAA